MSTKYKILVASLTILTLAIVSLFFFGNKTSTEDVGTLNVVTPTPMLTDGMEQPSPTEKPDTEGEPTDNVDGGVTEETADENTVSPKVLERVNKFKSYAEENNLEFFDVDIDYEAIGEAPNYDMSEQTVQPILEGCINSLNIFEYTEDDVKRASNNCWASRGKTAYKMWAFSSLKKPVRVMNYKIVDEDLNIISADVMSEDGTQKLGSFEGVWNGAIKQLFVVKTLLERQVSLRVNEVDLNRIYTMSPS